MSGRMTDRLLSEAEVSELLGVTIKCLQDWRYRRCGPRYIKVGRLPRYRSEDIETWLRERTVETSDSPTETPRLRSVR